MATYRSPFEGLATGLKTGLALRNKRLAQEAKLAQQVADNAEKELKKQQDLGKSLIEQSKNENLSMTTRFEMWNSGAKIMNKHGVNLPIFENIKEFPASKALTEATKIINSGLTGQQLIDEINKYIMGGGYERLTSSQQGTLNRLLKEQTKLVTKDEQVAWEKKQEQIKKTEEQRQKYLDEQKASIEATPQQQYNMMIRDFRIAKNQGFEGSQGEFEAIWREKLRLKPTLKTQIGQGVEKIGKVIADGAGAWVTDTATNVVEGLSSTAKNYKGDTTDTYSQTSGGLLGGGF